MAKICPRCSERLPDDAVFCPFDGAPLDKRDPFVGKTIAARYRLVKKLGAGGMSLVYLARHELISRLSALKLLRPELAQVPEHRERFLREARAVNRINHENIVEITDVGESDGVAYLVMEYVDGDSLLDQINAAPLRPERAVRIALQVASALARSHQTGVIHRDLKPENILLVPRSPYEKVKVIDFGIAKMTGEANLTMTAQLFGTPGYIAPEYVSGLPIDGRADIYSLGVVLYEMVTGQLPFEGKGQSDLLLKPLTTSPIPPSKRISGISTELEKIMMRCLERDPEARYQDAFALQDALEALARADDLAHGPAPETLDEVVRSPRAPNETIVDLESSPELSGARETANLGKMVTNEMTTRWGDALNELERLVAFASDPQKARAAGELAIVASEMIPRIDRATKRVAELQAKVDALELHGREFRTALGNAIDVLVHDRSRERAHVDALKARCAALANSIASSAGPPASDPRSTTDARPWEIEALQAEARRGEATVADLDFQIASLQKQLDEKNEAHERSLVQATGTLEGMLSAFRRLTNEIAKTIEDGIELVSS